MMSRGGRIYERWTIILFMIVTYWSDVLYFKCGIIDSMKKVVLSVGTDEVQRIGLHQFMGLFQLRDLCQLSNLILPFVVYIRVNSTA